MAITTPDAVPGEIVEAAWGDAVRADLTTLDTAVAARLPKSGGISQAMSGNLYVGGDPNSTAGALVRPDGVFQSSLLGPASTISTPNMNLTRATATASDAGGLFVIFRRSATGPAGAITIGSVTIGAGGSSVVYNTTSDERLKQELGDLEPADALDLVNRLRPIRFVWLGDETGTEVAGFLAHEVDEVVPDAVTGERGAVDADGNIAPQQLDRTALVPYLVAAVQSLAARVAALEAT